MELDAVVPESFPKTASPIIQVCKNQFFHQRWEVNCNRSKTSMVRDFAIVRHVVDRLFFISPKLLMVPVHIT